MSNNIHDSIKGVALFFGVEVIGVADKEGSGELLKLRHWYLTFNEGSGCFEGSGEEHGDVCV